MEHRINVMALSKEIPFHQEPSTLSEVARAKLLDSLMKEESPIMIEAHLVALRKVVGYQVDAPMVKVFQADTAAK